MSKIKGIIHPVPSNIAERIYAGKRFIVFKSLLRKAKPGLTFILYESKGAGAFTGWANIVSIKKMDSIELWKQYGDLLPLNKSEYGNYIGKKPIVDLIEIDHFQYFNEKFIPSKSISMRGRYIDEEEFIEIK